ncbi:J [Symbiodinium microadriaticum]|nr:J [Symbiodinium microadriaticum] [Symbiodinium microadriaticum]
MTAFSAINLDQLAAPDLVEALDFETILAAMKDDALSRAPAEEVDVLTEVLALESEPITILLETCAYRELLLRQRVNDAARAVMLAYASGADLDQLAALFGIARDVVQEADPEADPPIPEILEDDARLRQRVVLSLEGRSVAGPIGSYIFWALSADPDVKDVAVESPTPGVVIVSILSATGDGTATQDLLDQVDATISADDVRPLTDDVTVQAASITTYQVEAELTLFNGPDAEVVRQAAETAVTQYVSDHHKLGHDITISGLHQALHQPGVQKADLTQPAAEIIVSDNEAAFCNAATARLGAVPVPIKWLWHVDLCPPELLPWLAWALSVDEWDPAWSDDQKREVIAASAAIHRIKGTRAAVERALATLGVTVTLEEWWEQNPQGPAHTFDLFIDATGAQQDPDAPVLDADFYALTRRLTDATKPVRSHYALKLQAEWQSAFGLAGHMPSLLVSRQKIDTGKQTTLRRAAFGTGSHMPGASGLQAVFNADSNGLQAVISEIALGDQGYDPAVDGDGYATQTALQNEIERFPLADSDAVPPYQIDLSFIADGANEYWVREIGFYLDDGTLLAVWSDAAQTLAYKSAAVPLVLGFELVLASLPANSVTVQTTGGNLELVMTREIAVIGTAIARRQEMTTTQQVADLIAAHSDLKDKWDGWDGEIADLITYIERDEATDDLVLYAGNPAVEVARIEQTGDQHALQLVNGFGSSLVQAFADLGFDTSLELYEDGARKAHFYYSPSQYVLDIGSISGAPMRFVTNSTVQWMVDASGALFPTGVASRPLGTAANPVNSVYVGSVGIVGADPLANGFDLYADHASGTTAFVNVGSNTGGNGKGGIAPNTYDGQRLGYATNAWSEAWLVNGVQTPSDERMKTGIRDLAEAERRAYLRCAQNAKIFQWLDKYEAEGDDARLHTGVIAQEVIAIFEDEGLDPFRYACLGEDELTDRLEIEVERECPKTETTTVQVPKIVVEEGQPIRRLVDETIEQPVTELKPVIDDEGTPIVDDAGNPVMHPVPVMEIKTVTEKQMVPRLDDNGDPVTRYAIKPTELLFGMTAALAAELAA